MTLFLIAHKVRGERAFDVAEYMEMADGPWWIIPTSGHRAYPYWWHPLKLLLPYKELVDPPEDLPDHYPRIVKTPKGVKTEPAVSGELIELDLEELGL